MLAIQAAGSQLLIDRLPGGVLGRAGGPWDIQSVGQEDKGAVFAEPVLIDGASHIDPAWVLGVARVGVTAGASAPEILVQGVVNRLQELGAGTVEHLEGEPEDVVFALPKELRITLVN